MEEDLINDMELIFLILQSGWLVRVVSRGRLLPALALWLPNIPKTDKKIKQNPPTKSSLAFAAVL